MVVPKTLSTPSLTLSPEPDRPSANSPRVTFYGARCAAQDGAATGVFGGHSSCITIQGPGTLVILDAGSGMRTCGLSLMGKGPLEGHLFFSRPTVMRTLGLPFFAPAFSADNHFTLYSNGGDIKSALRRLMSDPVFPVSPDIFNATLTFRDLEPDTPVALASGITVTTITIGGAMPAAAHRFDGDGWSLAWAAGITSHEDARTIRDFAAGVSLAIVGGDADVIDALARGMTATTTVVTDHPPAHDDDALARREQHLQRLAPNARLARQGETLSLGWNDAARGGCPC